MLSWSVGGTDGTACSITAGGLTFSFGNLAAGAVKMITLSSPTIYVIILSWLDPLIITSTATGMGGNELAGTNNSATASTGVLCPRVYTDVLAENMTNFIAISLY